MNNFASTTIGMDAYYQITGFLPSDVTQWIKNLITISWGFAGAIIKYDSGWVIAIMVIGGVLYFASRPIR